MDYETPEMLVRMKDHVTIVRLKGPNLTGTGEIARITAALNHLVDEGARRVVIDFKLVQHVSSAGLGTLIALQKRLRDAEGRLVISHPEHITELLRVSRTDRLFEFAPDSKAAFSLLRPAAA